MFDYFRIEGNVSTDGLEQLSTRGLLAGTDYGTGRLAGELPDETRSRSRVGVFYTFLGSGGFGAVR